MDTNNIEIFNKYNFFQWLDRALQMLNNLNSDDLQTIGSNS